ncbi:MAG: hypothetical protein AN485_07455 [Anabaena sp. MDT14b]|nr:MAG: hypothetical protein AN485_07455 [Anabaena sp. MDT14b]
MVIDDGLNLVIDGGLILGKIKSVPIFLDIRKPPGFISSVDIVASAESLFKKSHWNFKFKIALTPITSRGFWRFGVAKYLIAARRSL